MRLLLLLSLVLLPLSSALADTTTTGDPTTTDGGTTAAPTVPSAPSPTSTPAPFECYTGQVANATDPKNVPPPGEKNATACEDGVVSCWWEQLTGPSGQMIERRCGMKEGCVEGLKGCNRIKLKEGGGELEKTVCCCESALCNGPDTPMSTPTEVVAPPPPEATKEPTKGAAAASINLATAAAAMVAARCY